MSTASTFAYGYVSSPAPTKLYLDIELGDAALSKRKENFDCVL